MQILNNFPKLTDFQRLNLIKIAKSNTNLLDSSRFKHVYPDSINIVDSRPNIPVFDILKGISDQIKKDYNLSSKFTLLVLKPQITPSFFPPHNDGARNLGINYVLNTGGDNVITRFYNKPGSYTKDDRMYWNEASLEKTSEFICKENCWYAFDAQQPHGVYNITSTRIVLLCFLSYNKQDIAYEDFQKIFN